MVLLQSVPRSVFKLDTQLPIFAAGSFLKLYIFAAIVQSDNIDLLLGLLPFLKLDTGGLDHVVLGLKEIDKLQLGPFVNHDMTMLLLHFGRHVLWLLYRPYVQEHPIQPIFLGLDSFSIDVDVLLDVNVLLLGLCDRTR
jgi:hypothetical protein